MSPENESKPRPLTLKAVLKRNQQDAFTSPFKGIPPFLTDGLDEEGALRNLVAESAGCLTGKTVRELHASQGRNSPDDGVELQIL